MDSDNKHCLPFIHADYALHVPDQHSDDHVSSKMVVLRNLALKKVPLYVRTYASSATFQTLPYKLHKLDAAPELEITVSRDEGLEYYRQMQLIRQLENIAGNLYRQQAIRGFCHLSTGQEACAVGVRASMTAEDAAITSYRCHGWTLLCGSTPEAVIGELVGKISGNVYGKGGSMHMYEKNFFGGNGIVGAQISLGAGVALAYKYNKQPNVCFTIYGDGAANQGQFFECTNMAALWKLPCVFVCENNGYGMGTSVDRASADKNFYKRGDFVPGIWVDAMDVISVKEAARFAKDYCIAGNGPIVLELATYRFVGHSVSDAGTSYRTREELTSARKTKDPIHNFRDRLIAAHLAKESDFGDIDKEVKKTLSNAVETAMASSVLPPEALYADLYANTEPQRIRGCTADEIVVQPHVSTDEIISKMTN
uniref:Pyruvate dehydrogenase E1 component subunit alpha n=1 Tax=Panagrellus redivivus TaxID=6233 RepID=A0A7E4W7M3_PANRE